MSILKDLPEKVNWLTIVLVLVSTGFVGQLVGVWDLSVKREDSYIDKFVKCAEQKLLLQQQNTELTLKLLTLELATNEMPFPYWIKNLNSEILYISTSYEKFILNKLGFEKHQVINTRGECFGDEFLELILRNDELVLRANQVMVFEEPIPDHQDGVSYKYPIKNHTGVVVAMGGFWVPKNLEDLIRFSYVEPAVLPPYFGSSFID